MLYILNVILVILPIIAFLLLAIISTIYAIYKLCKPGISDEVRGLVLRRHVLNVLFEFSINLYFMYSLYVVIRFGTEVLEERNASGKEYVAYTFKLIYKSQGLFLPLIRLFEPYFFHILWNKMTEAFICLRR